MPPDSVATPGASTVFSQSVERLRLGEPLGAVVEDLLDELTMDEMLGLLDGDVPFWDGLIEMNVAGYNRTPIPMGRVERLGIPGLLFSDGPRGVVMGHSTAFPVSMARGATWDRDLEERVGTAIGLEGRAQGANFFGGVCINLPRHPAWGRVQETYGEDPLLLGEMGAALVRGVAPNMMAVAKHYALNSMENARFTVDVSADDAALHEVFLAHFRRVVDEGVDGIMTSYNSVNGEWVGENEGLLEGVLRARWGFEGVTVSDFLWGLRDAAKSLRAGLDVEEPFVQQRAQHLPEAIRSGGVTQEHIERAARRILGTQLRYYAPACGPGAAFLRGVLRGASQPCPRGGRPGHGPAEERARRRAAPPPARRWSPPHGRRHRATGRHGQHGRPRIIGCALARGRHAAGRVHAPRCQGWRSALHRRTTPPWQPMRHERPTSPWSWSATPPRTRGSTSTTRPSAIPSCWRSSHHFLTTPHCRSAWRPC